MVSTEGLVPITRAFLASYYDKYPFPPLSIDVSRLSDRIYVMATDLLKDSPPTQGERLLVEEAERQPPHKVDENMWKNREQIEEILFMLEVPNWPRAVLMDFIRQINDDQGKDDDYKEINIPAGETHEGNFCTCVSGSYKLIWDNSYSSFFKKMGTKVLLLFNSQSSNFLGNIWRGPFAYVNNSSCGEVEYHDPHGNNGVKFVELPAKNPLPPFYKNGFKLLMAMP
ncbi:UNVERIFIED_CONTAM: hypothetical protein Sindi_2149900 [Sesamum indicum]